MNIFAERINSRRIECNVPVEQICEVQGWDNRKKYYHIISSVTQSWKFEEICKIINLFECTYEQLFRGMPFTCGEIYTYKIKNNLTSKLKQLAGSKNLKLSNIQDSLGTTRQNYYHLLSKKRLKIYQINSLLDTLKCDFSEVFCIKIFYKIVEKEKEETIYV
jgi:hypothetical protein